MGKHKMLVVLLGWVAVVGGGEVAWAQTPAEVSAASADAHRVQYDAAVASAIRFLRGQQAADGGYGSPADPGVTALVTTALIQHGVDFEDPMVARGLAYLETFVKDDGGIYRSGTYYRNYETCLAIMCFSEANGSRKYTDTLQRAVAFVKDIQWGVGTETDPSDPAYGGAGYGKHGRPDLSNTQFLLDALHAAGDAENMDAIQRALVFVSRCQNLDTEHNDTPFAERNPDGGFYYTGAAGGSSQAGNTSQGGLRSYGSMSYAGLKSMLYAGVSREDPRVQAVSDWLQQNYTLEENPGMGLAGLYYYYHTMAKALDALGDAKFVDQSGGTHVWRDELRQELLRRQQTNGSWLNDQDRWYEGDPKLVTGYALLTLRYCRP